MISLRFLLWLFTVPMVLGGLVYYLLAIVCARRAQTMAKSEPSPSITEWPPITLLKPLCGAEPELD